MSDNTAAPAIAEASAPILTGRAAARAAAMAVADQVYTTVPDAPDDPPAAAPEVEATPTKEPEKRPESEKGFKTALEAWQATAKEREAIRNEKKELDALKRLSESLTVKKPVDALKALNFSRDAIVEAMLDFAEVEKELEKTGQASEKAPAVPKEISEKLAALENEVMSARAEKAKNTIRGAISKVESVYVKGLGREEEVEQVMLEHIQKYGAPLGETLEESAAIATQVVESRLKEEAEKYSRLTTPRKSETVSGRSEVPAGVSGKTLPQVGVPSKPVSPQTREERKKWLLANLPD